MYELHHCSVRCLVNCTACNQGRSDGGRGYIGIYTPQNSLPKGKFLYGCSSPVTQDRFDVVPLCSPDKICTLQIKLLAMPLRAVNYLVITLFVFSSGLAHLFGQQEMHLACISCFRNANGLLLGVSRQDRSFHLWINMWVASKTVWYCYERERENFIRPSNKSNSHTIQ